MKNSWSTFIAPISVVTALAIGLVACDKKEEDVEAAAEGAAGGAAEETYSSDVTNGMDAVTKNFVPDSLKTDTTTTAATSLNLNSAVCGTKNYFDCQPILLKTYMSHAQALVTTFNAFVPMIDQYMLIKADGTNGGDDIEQQAGDTSGVNRLDYKKVSATEYAVVMSRKDVGPVVALEVNKVDGKLTYGLDFFMNNNASYVEGTMKKFTGEITFTDENTFDVNFQFGDSGCVAANPKNPELVIIDISRSNDLWKGKTMLYSPRWGAADCDTAISSATKLYSYTDFAADKEKVTSSLYLANAGLTDMANISNFASENFCTSFSPACSDGKLKNALGVVTDTVVSTTYKSPSCNNTATENVQWNGACTEPTVTDYSAATKWLLPSALEQKLTNLQGLEAPATTLR